MPVGTMEETEERPSVEELWQHFAEAEAAVAALGPTPEQLRSEVSVGGGEAGQGGRDACEDRGCDPGAAAAVERLPGRAWRCIRVRCGGRADR